MLDEIPSQKMQKIRRLVLFVLYLYIKKFANIEHNIYIVLLKLLGTFQV